MSISLTKGQRLSLNKASSTPLKAVSMGLGWDAKKKLFGLLGGSIDLDASCLEFDAQGNMIDAVWFQQLQSRDGAIRHSGDNLTGDGEGDDEVIHVALDRLPASVQSLVFTVNSFTGQSFKEVQNAYCRLIDASNQKELARYTLTETGDYTAQIMSRLYRHEGEWKLHAIGDAATGRIKTFHDMVPMIKQHL
ncbi:MAG: TerD family protein [Magnetococcales bacterium]|nr:TerD family protein [Magnetococcales bacterium]